MGNAGKVVERERARALRAQAWTLEEIAVDIAAARTEAEERIGTLTDRELLLAGLTLSAGEGFKTGNVVGFAKTDPRLVDLYLTWLRRCFEIDEARLRARRYLHSDLDLEAAETYWIGLTGIPRTQFTLPYRAAVGPKRGTRRHVHGCLTVRYSDVRLLRRITALNDALLSCTASIPG
jgi:hypothetical protein